MLAAALLGSMFGKFPPATWLYVGKTSHKDCLQSRINRVSTANFPSYSGHLVVIYMYLMSSHVTCYVIQLLAKSRASLRLWHANLTACFLSKMIKAQRVQPRKCRMERQKERICLFLSSPNELIMRHEIKEITTDLHGKVCACPCHCPCHVVVCTRSFFHRPTRCSQS